MESRELRIGNLLLWHGLPYGREVIKIDETSFTVKIDEITNVTVLPNMTNGIKPIPLSEEWLLKFGFEKVKNSNDYLMNIKDGWMLYYDSYIGALSIDSGLNGLFLENIKYVHQLQNLYLCLCGEELTLK